MAGKFRREAGTGSALARKDRVVALGLFAGAIAEINCLPLAEGGATTSWTVGGSGKEMAAGAGVCSSRASAKVPNTCREAVPIGFRLGWLRSRTGGAVRSRRSHLEAVRETVGLSTATVAGVGGSAAAWKGPPIARTEAVMLPPGESASKRNSTSLCFGW